MNEATLSKIIGEEGVFVDGDWVESKDQDANGDVRLIQLADVGDGTFISKSNRFLTSEKAEELKCTFLKPGDVLIARMPDPIGRACIFPGLDMPCITVVDVCIVRPDPNIADFNWLKFLINSYDFRIKINKYITGTTRKRISRGNLEKLSFYLPEIPEQIKIATVLNKAEALIKQRNESIAFVDEFLKNTFLKMHLTTDSNSLVEYMLADLKLGGNETFSNGPFGSDLLTSELTNEGVPVIYIRDIRNGNFEWKSEVYVTQSKADSLSSCKVIGDDLLIAKVGDPPGVSAIYPKNSPDAIITQDVIRIRLNQKIANPIWMKYYLNSVIGERAIKRITITGTRKRFSLGEFKKLDVNIPPINVQTKFAEIVEKAQAIKEQFKGSLIDLENLYGSLSQRAFKGELEINTEKIVQSIDGEIFEMEYELSIGMQAMSDDLPEGALEQYQKDVENITIEIERKRRLTNILRGDLNQTQRDQKKTKESERFPSKKIEVKEIGHPFEVDEETAKMQGAWFHKEWQRLHPKEKNKKSESKLTWDKVSSEQIANWIIEKYSGAHFTCEMLIRFLFDERITVPDYYSSEELKKYPHLNEAEDFKAFIFSAVSDQNPFIKLEQVFYDAEKNEPDINVSTEDYELIKNRSAKERSGIYFRIIE